MDTYADSSTESDTNTHVNKKQCLMLEQSVNSRLVNATQEVCRFAEEFCKPKGLADDCARFIKRKDDELRWAENINPKGAENTFEDKTKRLQLLYNDMHQMNHPLAPNVRKILDLRSVMRTTVGDGCPDREKLVIAKVFKNIPEISTCNHMTMLVCYYGEVEIKRSKFVAEVDDEISKLDKFGGELKQNIATARDGTNLFLSILISDDDLKSCKTACGRVESAINGLQVAKQKIATLSDSFTTRLKTRTVKHTGNRLRGGVLLHVLVGEPVGALPVLDMDSVVSFDKIVELTPVVHGRLLKRRAFEVLLKSGSWTKRVWTQIWVDGTPEQKNEMRTEFKNCTEVENDDELDAVVDTVLKFKL